MPGAPPLGAVMDFAVYFWCIIISIMHILYIAGKYFFVCTSVRTCKCGSTSTSVSTYKCHHVQVKILCHFDIIVWRHHLIYLLVFSLHFSHYLIHFSSLLFSPFISIYFYLFFYFSNYLILFSPLLFSFSLHLFLFSFFSFFLSLFLFSIVVGLHLLEPH